MQKYIYYKEEILYQNNENQGALHFVKFKQYYPFNINGGWEFHFVKQIKCAISSVLKESGQTYKLSYHTKKACGRLAANLPRKAKYVPGCGRIMGSIYIPLEKELHYPPTYNKFFIFSNATTCIKNPKKKYM